MFFKHNKNKEIGFIWRYDDAESKDEDISDLHISISQGYLMDFISKILSLTKGESIVIKLDDLPKGTPYNLDDKKDIFNKLNLKTRWYNNLVIESSLYEDNVIIEVDKERVVLVFTETTMSLFVFYLLKTRVFANVYDWKISINFLEKKGYKTIASYEANLVFWCNVEGKPVFIP